MDPGFNNECGAVPSGGVSFDTGADQDSPSKQTPPPVDSVMAEAVKRPSLSSFEGIPVEIRVMIYSYILIFDADVSLRAVSEMESQISPSSDGLRLPMELWIRMGIPNWPRRSRDIIGNGRLTVSCAPQFTPLQNNAILSASRKINREATEVLCANNSFHYSCMRSFPGGTIDLLRNVSWPVPFSGTQLYFMRSLSLDYCNSHYDHWTDAAVEDIDDCMARNITHIDEACPSLKTFTLYIFSRPPLAPQFRGRLGTGQAALALGKIRKRLDWLNLVFTVTGSSSASFRETIAPGVIWQGGPLRASGLPKVTISKWQLGGVQSRWDYIQVVKLDCKRALKGKEAVDRDSVPEDTENGGSQAVAGPSGDDEMYDSDDEMYDSEDEMYGSSGLEK